MSAAFRILHQRRTSRGQARLKEMGGASGVNESRRYSKWVHSVLEGEKENGL